MLKILTLKKDLIYHKEENYFQEAFSLRNIIKYFLLTIYL